MLAKFIHLSLCLVPVLAASVAFIGMGFWLRRKQYGPEYDVGGMVAIVLGLLLALGGVLMVLAFVAYTGPPLPLEH